MVELMCANEDNYSLHIAARSGKIEKMLQILDSRPDLIRHQNRRGDNPLHVAAEAGHLGVVELLIALVQSPPTSQSSGSSENIAKETPSMRKNDTIIDIQEVGTVGITNISEAIWKTRNHDGSTALHEAIRNKHEDIALHLLDVDSEPVEFANKNNESPLYLAAKAGFVRVLHKILEASRNPSTVGPNGQTPFHAAVFTKSQESIEVLYGWIPALINKKDSAGKTALHYATQEDSLEITRQLLVLDASSARECDSEGLSPLLVAVKKGRSALVLAILNACPDSIKSSDKNGYNALHLAVRHNTIEKFKTLLSFPKIKSLANKGDCEGNTPLHLAAKEQKYHHVRAILRSTTKVESKAKNNTGQTAFDLCHSDRDLSYEQRQIRDALSKPTTLLRRYVPIDLESVDDFKWLEENEGRDLSQTTNAMSVVAGLIATITFGAVLQIPGGYNSQGSPTLIHTPALKAFLLTDTIAFCFSIVALCYLVNVFNENKDILLMTAGFLIYALWFTMMAFIFGIYAVISTESQSVAIVVSVICCFAGLACYEVFRSKFSDLFRKLKSENL